MVEVALWLSGFATITLTAPAAWAGVAAVIEMPLTRVTAVAGVPPKLTVAPVRKPDPAMVTLVPPAVVPETGDIEAIVGGGLM